MYKSAFFSAKLTFWLLILIAVVTTGFAQNSITQRPNIILILADDLGYGDLGCYGQQKIATPNLDAMAKEGVRFTQFYSGCAVCAPARATLLMGQHTGHTPVRGNKGVEPEGQSPLPYTALTFVQLLQKNGYNTAAFGKWGLGYFGTSGDPNKKGFNQFFGYNCQSLAHNYYPDHLWNNSQRINFPENEVKPTTYSADLIHQKAIQFLQQQTAKQPFFLFLPYTVPHADLAVPHDSVYNKYVTLFNESPLPGKTTEGKRLMDAYPHAAYAAMVSRLDTYVGQIRQLIKNKQLDANTLVLFMSDNGPHKESGNDPAFFNSNGSLKGIKRDLYEGGIREPFIATWPGTIQSNTTSNHISAMWDLFPTLLEMAHVPYRATKVDGISMLPTFLGKPQPPQTYLYWELHESGGKQAIRMGKWKGVKLNVSEQAYSPLALYDLEKDVTERVNLADRFPVIVKMLDKMLQEAHRKDVNWPLLPNEK